MTALLISWGIVAFVISFVLTRLLMAIGFQFNLVDVPKGKRKIHKNAVPLGGGLAIFLAVTAVIGLILYLSDVLTTGEITQMHYVGVFIGGLILMIGGVLDDRYSLPPKLQIVTPVLAALAVIGFGLEIDKLTNPFGGVLHLATWQSNTLVFIWLMIVMYTTKFLDGVDGLATGVSGIGAMMVMLLALTIAYFQPDVALFAAVSIGAFLGFLLWNLHPARIFLGEGGSTFVGFLLGVLAVISGSKLATALLVIGVPLLDLTWVLLRRFKEGGLKRMATGDRKHLHHRLLDLGWSQRRVMWFYLAVASAFGGAALFLQSRDKVIALSLLTLLMIIAAIFLTSREKHAV